MKGIFYHGSKHKVDKLTDDYVGGKNATDQEGPGIYFTTSPEEAAGYGTYIYKVELSAKKILGQKKNTSVSKLELIKLIKMSESWQEDAQNWHENPDVGARVAAESAIEYNDTDKDVFLQIWIDFYKYKGREYVRNMAKLGYDGIVIPRWGDKEGYHFIVYNPSIINIIEVKVNEIQSEIKKFIKECINKLIENQSNKK